jgi:hypothetical protein
MRSACFVALVRPVLAGLLCSVLGCSSDKDHMEKQLSKLREEVQHLQSDTDRMGERLDAMEVRQAAVPHYAEERVAQSSTTLSRPKLKVVRVEPGGEGASAEAEPADAPPDADSGPRVLIQGEGKSLESRTLTLPAAPVAAKSTKPEASKSKPESEKSKKSDSPKAAKPEAASPK